MTTIEELEKHSTEELRERAFTIAKRHLDVKFFWDLLEAVPAVEAAAGHQREAAEDILSRSQLMADDITPESPEKEEDFRPIILECNQEPETRETATSACFFCSLSRPRFRKSLK